MCRCRRHSYCILYQMCNLDWIDTIVSWILKGTRTEMSLLTVFTCFLEPPVNVLKIESMATVNIQVSLHQNQWKFCFDRCWHKSRKIREFDVFDDRVCCFSNSIFAIFKHWHRWHSIQNFQEILLSQIIKLHTTYVVRLNFLLFSSLKHHFESRDEDCLFRVYDQT